jgi:hypothetical protein
VPMPSARPNAVIAAARPMLTASLSAKPRAAEKSMVTASLSSKAVRHNVWGDPVVARPAVSAQSPFELASAEPATTGSADSEALSYASEHDAAVEPVLRARPMGRHIPRLAREATVISTAANSTIAVKPPMTIGGQRTDSPWLRAAMLTPSVSGFMTATRLGRVDPKWLSALFDKPAHSVVMSFSADPSLGMVANRFSGHAVVFLATATFTTQTTASLQ